MRKIARKIINASLFGLLMTGTAVASSDLAPVGTLQAGAHASIQNELGGFPVSGTYTVLTGDKIEIGESDTIATLTMDAGTLYILPNSSLSLSESNGVYTVALASGSVGYELDGDGVLKIISSGKEITPVATEGSTSGAVATGPNGKLVVVPVIGDALAMTDDGVVTTIAQGYTWSDDGQGARLTPTQVQTGNTMTAGKKALIVAGSVAGAFAFYEVFINDENENSKSPSR